MIYKTLKIGAVLLLPLLLSALFIAGTPLAPSPEAPENFTGHLNREWMQNEYWFKGTAELNFYDSQIVKYNTPRHADQVVQILVTEKHKPDELVKVDDWRQPGLVDMLKFNYLTTVQTGIYTYREMMSVFFDQRSLKTAKMTFSSQEWCGASFKELVNYGGRQAYRFTTYWDGMGHGEYPVRFPDDMVLYDALVVQLRMLKFQPGLELKMNLLPTQISSRVQKPAVEIASAIIGEPVKQTVPAGVFRAFPVTVRHSGGEDRFWIEAAFPNRVVRWESYAGNRYVLLESKNLPYWKLKWPGDEKYLPGGKADLSAAQDLSPNLSR